MLLPRRGRPVEAEAAISEAIRLQPDWPAAHQVLSGIVRLQGRLDEAEAAGREAVRLGPDNGINNLILGHALMARGKFAEAEAQYREAIRIHPDLVTAWGSLGLVLEHQWKPAEAEAAIREAARLRPESAWPHYRLGVLLRRQGRMEEALAALRRAAAQSGPETMPGSASSVAAEIRRAERQLVLAPRLPAILKGEDRPADAAEGLDLARLCLDRDRPATAARLYAEALAADPGRADDRAASPRPDAAHAAALAGCGRGCDDPPPDGEARARLRRQALDWLEQERAAWAKVVDSGDPNGSRRATDEIVGWTIAPDLAGVREPEALALLPEAERVAWRSFWDEVDELLQRVVKARR
jgi:tetratricopeptide (TPR) repeat protein